MTASQRGLAVVLTFSAFPLMSVGSAARAIKRASHPAHTAGMRLSPHDSFLKYNSYSLDGVLKQMQATPALQRRYARHFGIPESRVMSYFRENLVESYVPKTMVYPVWCVKPNGQRYIIHQRFTKGTRVLSLRNGQPVLKWACGNPLSNKLPAVHHKKVRTAKVLPSVQTRVVNVVTPFETAPPVKPRRMLVAALPPAFTVAGSSLTPLLRILPVVGGVHIPGILGLGILPIIHGGGGGSTPPVVPEPSTLAMGVTGLAGAWTLRRRKR